MQFILKTSIKSLLIAFLLVTKLNPLLAQTNSDLTPWLDQIIDAKDSLTRIVVSIKRSPIYNEKNLQTYLNRKRLFSTEERLALFHREMTNSHDTTGFSLRPYGPLSLIELETLRDIAAIHAIAAIPSKQTAQLLFDFAQSPIGSIYQKECQRLLSTMDPWAILVLIEQLSFDNLQKRNYAKTILEQMDRENPFKALQHAPSNNFKIKLLQAYGKTTYREAVPAILQTALYDNFKEVRDQAQKTWFLYVQGKPHTNAPKRKLALPQGKLSQQEYPLWLSYNKYAIAELLREYKKTFGSIKKKSSTKLSQELFDYFETKHANNIIVRLTMAHHAFAQKDYKQAVYLYNLILVDDPMFLQRQTMASAFLFYAKTIDVNQSCIAARLYGKAIALGLDTQNEHYAYADMHFSKAMCLMNEGYEGNTELQSALYYYPTHPSATAVLTPLKQIRYKSNQIMLWGAMILFLLTLGFVFRIVTLKEKDATRKTHRN